MHGCLRRARLVCSGLAWIVLSTLAFAADDPSRDAVEETPLRFRVVVDAPSPYRGRLENGLPIARWQDNSDVTPSLLRRLAEEARADAADAMAAYGYFSATVKSVVDTTAGKEATVRIDVDPGPRTRIRGLDLQFRGTAESDPEGRRRIELVKSTWTLKPGEPFTQEEWDSAKRAALARLARGRYAAATIAGSAARIDPAERQADLEVTLDSGPMFRAGRTVVTGLRRYPASIVENMNPMRPGEPYDATKLDLLERRLLETRYFNAVQATVDPDPAQAAAAPLRVNVIEAPAQRIEGGVEFSTDTRLGVRADYSHANVLDEALRFRTLLELNAKRQNLHLNLDTPPRPGGVWTSYWTRLTREDIQGQTSREGVVGAGLNWGLEQTPSQLFVSAHVEKLMIAGSTRENNDAVFIGWRRTFRTTDEVVAPRQGLLGTVEVGTSVPGLSTREFARVRAKVNWLIPFGLRNDVLVRGETGVVLAAARSGIPSSFLFRTGGDQTVRGYAFQSIGVPEGEAIVGGRYMALGSVEYTRWISDSLGAAVFVDAGDAFDRRKAMDIAVGYGAGVRWRSPIGPFRADVAYGERTKALRLHFSVGYSF